MKNQHPVLAEQPPVSLNDPDSDPEIEAIGLMVAALRPFDKNTRSRMLWYVRRWADDPKTLMPGMAATRR